jgi:ribosome modulation factor
LQEIDMELPPDMSHWNPALVGAFKKGMAAHENGQSIRCCPYADQRKKDGRLSWSRAFRNAWFDGWYWAAQKSVAQIKPEKQNMEQKL